MRLAPELALRSELILEISVGSVIARGAGRARRRLVRRRGARARGDATDSALRYSEPRFYTPPPGTYSITNVYTVYITTSTYL